MEVDRPETMKVDVYACIRKLPERKTKNAKTSNLHLTLSKVEFDDAESEDAEYIAADEEDFFLFLREGWRSSEEGVSDDNNANKREMMSFAVSTNADEFLLKLFLLLHQECSLSYGSIDFDAAQMDFRAEQMLSGVLKAASVATALCLRSCEFQFNRKQQFDQFLLAVTDCHQNDLVAFGNVSMESGGLSLVCHTARAGIIGDFRRGDWNLAIEESMLSVEQLIQLVALVEINSRIVTIRFQNVEIDASDALMPDPLVQTNLASSMNLRGSSKKLEQLFFTECIFAPTTQDRIASWLHSHGSLQGVHVEECVGPTVGEMCAKVVFGAGKLSHLESFKWRDSSSASAGYSPLIQVMKSADQDLTIKWKTIEMPLPADCDESGKLLKHLLCGGSGQQICVNCEFRDGPRSLEYVADSQLHLRLSSWSDDLDTIANQILGKIKELRIELDPSPPQFEQALANLFRDPRCSCESFCLHYAEEGPSDTKPLFEAWKHYPLLTWAGLSEISLGSSRKSFFPKSRLDRAVIYYPGGFESLPAFLVEQQELRSLTFSGEHVVPQRLIFGVVSALKSHSKILKLHGCSQITSIGFVREILHRNELIVHARQLADRDIPLAQWPIVLARLGSCTIDPTALFCAVTDNHELLF